MVVFPIFLLILVFPKEILMLLYGSKYAGGSMALIVLALGIAVNDFSGTSANMLVGGGRTRLNLLCEVIAAVTNIGLNILLIPAFGIVGAAIATAMSYVTRNISSLTFCYKSYGMHPYSRKYLNIIASGLAAAAIVAILKHYSPFPWWATMVALGAIFIVFYIAAVLFSRGLERSDLVIVEAIERKTGRKLDSIKKFVG
jgi:O-antigen/teichoic acid export membrane protein